MKANMEIRQEAAKAGVKLWWIADKLGIADTGLSKNASRFALYGS